MVTKLLVSVGLLILAIVGYFINHREEYFSKGQAKKITDTMALADLQARMDVVEAELRARRT